MREHPHVHGYQLKCRNNQNQKRVIYTRMYAGVARMREHPGLRVGASTPAGGYATQPGRVLFRDLLQTRTHARPHAWARAREDSAQIPAWSRSQTPPGAGTGARHACGQIKRLVKEGQFGPLPDDVAADCKRGLQRCTECPDATCCDNPDYRPQEAPDLPPVVAGS